MLNHEYFAITLARAVALFGERQARVPEQKAALRALVALSSLGPADIVVVERGLLINGVAIPDSLPFIHDLAGRMRDHSVSEIRISQAAAAAELLRLMRGLASAADSQESHLLSSLARIGEGRTVTVLGVPAVTGAPEEESEISRSLDLAAAIAEGESAGRGDEEAVAEGAWEAYERLEKDLSTALASLEDNVTGQVLAERLEKVSTMASQALADERADEAVAAMAALIRLESSGNTKELRDGCGAVLDRLLTGPNQLRLLQLAQRPEYARGVVSVLQRLGDFGMDAVWALVTEGVESGEHVELLATIREDSGVHSLVDRSLASADPTIVRKAAYVSGQLRLEGAAAKLEAALSHPDERVQEAAVAALCRLPPGRATEALNRALSESSPKKRKLVAYAMSSLKSATLVRILKIALTTEPDGEVRREYYRALGRADTPEAIEVLIQAAVPSGRFFGRRPTHLRLEALEGLKLAKGDAARAVLEELTRDRDKTVRESARAALEDLAKGNSDANAE